MSRQHVLQELAQVVDGAEGRKNAEGEDSHGEGPQVWGRRCGG
ncbi:hypothetical protein AB0D27_08960 [Streptomyces sp. NPDC048415]